LILADAAAELILKAQIHAGGRGKGHFDNGYKGGVKIFTEYVDVMPGFSTMSLTCMPLLARDWHFHL